MKREELAAIDLKSFHPGARETMARLIAAAYPKPGRAALRVALDDYARWSANDLPEAEPHAQAARAKIERMVFGEGA